MKGTNWEARYFFSMIDPALLWYLHQLGAQILDVEFKIDEDIYFRNGSGKDVVKLRGDSFDIKRHLQTNYPYQAFDNKLVTKLPINLSTMTQENDQLSGIAEADGAINGLSDFMPWALKTKITYDQVTKVRHIYTLENGVRMETCLLDLRGDKYFSYCFESKNLISIEESVKEFEFYCHKEGVEIKWVMGYVDFLTRIDTHE